MSGVPRVGLLGLLRCARAVGLSCVLALACVSSAAGAEDVEARQQAADALFEQGRRLLVSGQYTQACAKLEASQGLDPGLGTLLFLGECYEKAGKSASAWRAFAQAAVMAGETGDRERGRLARIRSVALEPRLAKLRVRTNKYTHDLDALELTLNGVALSRRELLLPIFVDPGVALLQVTAPGHQHWEVTLQIHEGPSSLVVDVPALSRLGGAEDESMLTRDFPLSPAAPPAALAVAPTDSGSGVRAVALILGAAGIVSAGVGVYYGVRAVNLAQRSKELGNCPLEDRCYAQGLALREEARDKGHLADVAVGVGGALLLGGVVLYLVTPSVGSSAAPRAYDLTVRAGHARATVQLEASF